MYKSLVLLVAIVALNYNVCYGANNFKVIFHDLTIDYFNPEYFSKLEGKLTPNNGDVTVDTSFTIVKDIDKPINVNLYAFEKIDGSYAGPSIYNMSTEICAAFEKPQYFPTLAKIYSSLLKSGKLPMSCPIKMGQYDISNHLVDQSVFPPDMPGEFWKLVIEVQHNTVLMYNYTIHMQLDRSKA